MAEKIEGVVMRAALIAKLKRELFEVDNRSGVDRAYRQGWNDARNALLRDLEKGVGGDGEPI